MEHEIPIPKLVRETTADYCTQGDDCDESKECERVAKVLAIPVPVPRKSGKRKHVDLTEKTDFRSVLKDVYGPRVSLELQVGKMFWGAWEGVSPAEQKRMKERLGNTLGPFATDPEATNIALARVRGCETDKPSLPPYGDPASTKEMLRTKYAERRSFENVENLYAMTQATLACMKALLTLSGLTKIWETDQDGAVLSDVVTQLQMVLGFVAAVSVVQ